MKSTLSGLQPEIGVAEKAALGEAARKLQQDNKNAIKLYTAGKCILFAIINTLRWAMQL